MKLSSPSDRQTERTSGNAGNAGDAAAAGDRADSPNISKLTNLLGGPLDVRSFMLTGLFVLALLAVLYAARPILVPMVLAMLLAVMLGHLVRWLRDRVRIPLPSVRRLCWQRLWASSA